MFNGLDLLQEMGTVPFELTDEQEAEYKSAAEALHEVSERLDVPTLVLATVGSIDKGDTMSMKGLVLAHIDTRKASPLVACIAGALDMDKRTENIPTYARLLSACVLLAVKEKGVGEAWKLMEAIRPILDPYLDDARGETRLDGLSEEAREAFESLIERLEFEIEDDEDDKDD